MIDFIVIFIIAIIVGMSLLYIYKEKKKGVQCIGCVHGQTCSKISCDSMKEYYQSIK